MAYIGNTPAENYASFLTETFTVSATASYTLSHAVANENDIRLVINGVVQQPGSGKAYTASGTTLTLSSATVSGDVMYAVYLGRALQTVNPPNASVGTAQISSSARTTNLLYPAFEAQGSAEQTGVDNAWTKLNINTEVFDTNSMYDTSTYRFTPTVAGKYNVYGQVGIYSNTNYQLQIPNLAIYKNGSNYKYSANNEGNTNYPNERTLNITAVLEMNGSSDYIELYARANVISGVPVFETVATISNFGAYRIGS